MKTWILDLIAWAIAWLAVLCVPARGEWVSVPPVRSTGYPGVLGQIEDRMPGQTTKWGGNPDRRLWAHEAAHNLNSRLSLGNGGQWDLYFVPVGGIAYRITRPDHWVPGVFDGRPGYEKVWPVSGAELVRAIGGRRRAPSTATYHDLAAREKHPTIFIDELSAHVCGIEAGRQFNQDVRTDVVSALDMLHGSHTLAAMTRQRGFPQTAAEIEEFCAWCAAYLRDNGLVR